MLDLSPPKALGPTNFNLVEGIQIRFDVKSVDFERVCDEIIERSQRIHDAIVNLSPEDCTFDKVFVTLGLLEAWMSTYSTILTFPQYVSTDKRLRDVSSKAQQRISEFEISASMREDLYTAVKRAEANTDLATLENEDRRLVEKMLLEFKRNGLDLPSRSGLSLKPTIADDETSVELLAEELEGMPAEYLLGLESRLGNSGEKLYVVTMKRPDVSPLLETCAVSETRRKVQFAYGARCKSNIAVLEEVMVRWPDTKPSRRWWKALTFGGSLFALDKSFGDVLSPLNYAETLTLVKAIALRSKAAQLMGYQTHADFMLEIKMAQSPKMVNEFLASLESRLKEIGEQELSVLVALKKEAEPDATRIESWDLGFWRNQLLKAHFKVDRDKVKQYFPLDHVTTKMLDIYQDVLNLDFERVEDPQPWNRDSPDDVKLIRVRDRETLELLGYFYLDLFPRTGKYPHAACFPLQPGCLLDCGEFQVPVAAMVANFTKPTASSPSLLRHSELITYFHELGHVMHCICSKTKWARFHGTSVEGDFVEAPSQMLENWCWDASVLARLSSHHATGETIPEELMRSLIAAKNAGVGLLYLRQLFFATFDMRLHSLADGERCDTTALYSRLREEVSLISEPMGTCAAATFGHLMGGYDAGYYGYLWSEVFSTDMFATKFKPLADIAGPRAGADYRRSILLPGASRDGLAMLKDFLGRAPSQDAFLESIRPPDYPPARRGIGLGGVTPDSRGAKPVLKLGGFDKKFGCRSGGIAHSHADGLLVTDSPFSLKLRATSRDAKPGLKLGGYNKDVFGAGRLRATSRDAKPALKLGGYNKDSLGAGRVASLIHKPTVIGYRLAFSLKLRATSRDAKPSKPVQREGVPSELPSTKNV
ncbi:metalloendopeptidase [Massospora cicadina]|nr:metalloendopeptidase [Massospora cicadina]